jgi:hypothetical protein
LPVDPSFACSHPAEDAGFLRAIKIRSMTTYREEVKPSARAVPWLRSLVTGLSPRRSGFAPGSIHVGFVVDKVALGQVFLRVLRFSTVNISFHRRSPNSYHLGNAYYANVSRHPRLGTRPTPSSGKKNKPSAPCLFFRGCPPGDQIEIAPSSPVLSCPLPCCLGTLNF